MSNQLRLMKRLPRCHSPFQAAIPQGYVSLQEAARWASVSKKTVKRWMQGGLPVYQAGPRMKVLVRLEDIERFLTRRQASSVDVGKLVNEVVAKVRG